VTRSIAIKGVTNALNMAANAAIVKCKRNVYGDKTIVSGGMG
jgi:hypothetical protein